MGIKKYEILLIILLLVAIGLLFYNLFLFSSKNYECLRDPLNYTSNALGEQCKIVCGGLLK